MYDQTIPAKNFRRGRDEDPRLIVIHSTEGSHKPGAARNTALWFAGKTAPQASAHYIVGVDETILCVDEDDTAWHVGAPVNGYSIGIELTANCANVKNQKTGVVVMPAFTAADWQRADVQAMLDRAARVCADICARRGIPATFVDHEGILAEEWGITTHAMVSKAFPRGTNHTDPGALFPMAEFIERVRSIMADAPTVDASP